MKKLPMLLIAVALAGCATVSTARKSGGICVKEGETIAFLGDSITQFGNYPDGYVNMVMRGLEVAGVKAAKLPAGISGNTSWHMVRRVNGVIARKPQWMTLSCGVNDVWHGARGVKLEDYKKNIGDILDKCEEAGVKVIVLTATMIYEDENCNLNQSLIPYNEFLREEAKKRHLLLADLNADMQAELKRLRAEGAQGNTLLTKDGVHMAFRGNCMMAWGILRTMGVPEEKRAAIETEWCKMAQRPPVM